MPKRNRTGARRTTTRVPAQPARVPQDRCDASPPRSEVADDLLAFASALRANVNEASKFCEDEVAKRLGWGATKKAETHFFTRATTTSKALRQRRKEFDGIKTRCKSADPCRPLINDLAAGGIRRYIDIVAADLEDIAARAGRPLSDHDRDELRVALQGVRRSLDDLHEIAAWIEDEASAIRGQTVPGRSSRSGIESEPDLPPAIANVVQEAESDASRFINVVAESTSALVRSDSESTLAWLKRLDPEIPRLEAASNRVVRRLQRFTDRDRADAEAQGHTRFLQFLDKRERVLRRVAGRRAISTGLVRGVIEGLLARLSLSDMGAEAVGRIGRQLEDFSRRLQSDQSLLERQADNAANERLANAVTVAQLPTWAEILGHGERGNGGPSNLAMLLMAFVDDSGEAPDFEPATRKQLKQRMDQACVRAGQRRLSDRQLKNLLEKLLKLHIVYKHDRPKKTSRRQGDEFSPCKAAIRKYRRNLFRS